MLIKLSNCNDCGKLSRIEDLRSIYDENGEKSVCSDCKYQDYLINNLRYLTDKIEDSEGNILEDYRF